MDMNKCASLKPASPYISFLHNFKISYVKFFVDTCTHNKLCTTFTMDKYNIKTLFAKILKIFKNINF